MLKITQIYSNYVLAYNKYVDKYFRVGENEEACMDEIEVCDRIYEGLNEKVYFYCNRDENMADDIMNILSRTEFSTAKIDMAQNMYDLHNYLQEMNRLTID